MSCVCRRTQCGYVRSCVYVGTIIHVHIHVGVHHVCDVYIHNYLGVYFVYIPISMYVSYVCVYVPMYVCIFTCMYVCTFMCMCMFVYVHIMWMFII